jgi:hypothetical protein
LRFAEDGPQCIAPSTRHCVVVQPRAETGTLCNVSHAAYFKALFLIYLPRSLFQDGNFMAKSSVGSVPARAAAPRQQQQQQHEDDADPEEFFMA